MKSLAGLLFFAIGLYLVICIAYYALQERMIFYPYSTPNPVSPNPGVRPVEIIRPDAILRGWVVNPDHPGPLLFYYGGNAEELSLAVDRFRALPATTVLVNYRGYGQSTGTPGEAALVADAQHILESFMDPKRPIYLVGGSLGSGVAGRIARPDLAGLVLVSPFRSLAEVARHHLPWLPVALLLKHRFDIRPNLENFPRRTLVIVGKRDRIIPSTESHSLAQLLPGQVELVELDADHNDLWSRPAFWSALTAFLTSGKTLETGA